MRVVFSSMASKSHLFGLVPLAWAFRAAGHEVRVVASPALTEDITAAGLTAVPVGTDVDLVDFMTHAGHDIIDYVRSLDFSERDPATLTWEHLLGMQTVLTPTFYALMSPDTLVEGMVSFCRKWQPDLVIWEPLTFAAPIAAAVTGTPHARLLWGPDITTRARQNFLGLLSEQPEEHREDPLAEWLTWTLEKFGGPAFDEEVVVGQWTIDPAPAGIRLDTGLKTVGMRYVDYNGPSVVPEWLHDEPERRRVCLTLGISSRENSIGQVSIDELLGAVGDIDAEIIATFDAQQLEGVASIPDNVRTVGFVPMHALLPTCSATVHHGGPGSWHTAAIHGVPQVILPDGWDTGVRAQRTQDFGAGIALPVPELTPDQLRESVKRVLDDPAHRAAAARMREDMLAEPSPAEVVGICEELAAGRRDPR
ncbi:activator-dependent family glycosyltransferase [Saccharopolyspora erythraea]|uniref:3-alpha-mycarosylerythronolide B desosaminyl transferase n=1 Tax=Saccharopolyspora erythraea TaxID=1836 RepID=UPI001BAC770F|nr:3-alpha-mycarosylerythronolide B desosaminyl transferase [Saccharopolyspora erythraea]QUH00055.1 activator-dependent family glycosyltransferase [Saccharopolyspora erythraea]